MATPFESLRTAGLILCFLFSVGGSNAQNATQNITPKLAHRVEAKLRSIINFPPGTTLSYSARSTSAIPGYDRLEVQYVSRDGKSGRIPLLVSKDGTRLAQFTTYDISVDPKMKFPTGDRPPRGGPANAPVWIVVYDDLECPFCARLDTELFPALLDRYKNQVRVVYRSFPIEGHPWAMHAAVDTDCLGAQSASAYWAAVDTIHSHFAEYGGARGSLTIALKEIDAETRKQGQTFKINAAKLDACIAKQDTAAEVASVRQGEQLGVESTPTIFINGVKVVGAEPIEFLFEMVDDALRAEGKKPPSYASKEAATTTTPKDSASAIPRKQ